MEDACSPVSSKPGPSTFTVSGDKYLKQTGMLEKWPSKAIDGVESRVKGLQHVILLASWMLQAAGYTSLFNTSEAMRDVAFSARCILLSSAVIPDARDLWKGKFLKKSEHDYGDQIRIILGFTNVTTLLFTLERFNILSLRRCSFLNEQTLMATWFGAMLVQAFDTHQANDWILKDDTRRMRDLAGLVNAATWVAIDDPTKKLGGLIVALSGIGCWLF